MLIAIEELFKNNVISAPQTKFQERLSYLYKKFSKEDWFSQMYEDIHTTQKNAIVIKAKHEIDIDSLPCRSGEYQIRYFWDGYEQPTIEEAAQIFRDKHSKDYWFVSIKVSKSGKYLEVLMRNNKRILKDRPDFFRNYPVQYEVEVHWQKSDIGNPYSNIITSAGEDDGTCNGKNCGCNDSSCGCDNSSCENCANLDCARNKMKQKMMKTGQMDVFGVYHKPQEVNTSKQVIITNH